jgi:Flp pilus assembly protein TadD
MVRRQLPASPSGSDALGWAYYKLGSSAPAIVQLKESVDKVPTNPMFRYHLGMAYMTAGHLDLARQQMRTLLKDYPGASDAGRAKAALERMSSRN